MIVGVIPTIIKVFAILFTNNFFNTTFGVHLARAPLRLFRPALSLTA